LQLDFIIGDRVAPVHHGRKPLQIHVSQEANQDQHAHQHHEKEIEGAGRLCYAVYEETAACEVKVGGIESGIDVAEKAQDKPERVLCRQFCHVDSL